MSVLDFDEASGVCLRLSKFGVEYVRFGAVSSVVRAPASHAGGHWFKSSTAHHLVIGTL